MRDLLYNRLSVHNVPHHNKAARTNTIFAFKLGNNKVKKMNAPASVGLNNTE